MFKSDRSHRRATLPELPLIRTDTLIENLEAAGYTATEFYEALKAVRRGDC